MAFRKKIQEEIHTEHGSLGEISNSLTENYLGLLVTEKLSLPLFGESIQVLEPK